LRSTRTPRSLSLILLFAAAVAALLATAGSEGAAPRPDTSEAERWRGLVGEERARVALGNRVIVLLKAPSLAQRVAAAGREATEPELRAWNAAALAAQKQLAAKLAGKGVPLVPELTFTRVVNGFSAPLDPRGVALLERDEDVQGVYPVRAAYPASLSSTALVQATAPLRPGPALPGFDGTGVTVALLDTGVDVTHPFIRRQALPGIDIVTPEGIGAPRHHPLIPARTERHGTQLAGIVAGSGGPGGLTGVAPGAHVLPIRVAGWQPDAQGGFAVYARSDQLLAGLESAVDPNGDGSTLDGARIALVGVVEPFAAFPDGAVARAVDGAAKLDTLVVGAAGNDGPAGPAYGSVGGPAGAPAALAVGASDGRRAVATVRVLLRSGLDVLFDGAVPLGGAVVPQRALTAPVAAPGRLNAGLPTDRRAAAGFFDAQGYSRVAGRAALVAPSVDPQQAQRDAAAAGAAAVVLDGVAPAGALGLDEHVGIPVVGLPLAATRAARRALGRKLDVTISIGAPAATPNPAFGRIAPFTSRGLAFGGAAKPELSAAGLALATAEPGRNEDGRARYATVNGTSGAAAVAAGAAALLAQARPALHASELKAALVDTAFVPEGAGLAAAGGGRIDLTRASVTEIAAEPAAISFGPMVERGVRAVRTLTVHNISTRRLALLVTARVPGVAGVTIDVKPRRLSLARGRSARVRLTARAAFVYRRLGGAEGVVRIRSGSQAVSVPWTIAFPPPVAGLLSDVRLSAGTFRASDTQPAVLSFRAGRVKLADGRPQVEPVEVLEVQLWHKRRQIGVLARLRDLLPGRYAFGITGRGPLGGGLPTGLYRLRVVAVPAGGRGRTFRELPFRLR
jgi:minor extracellular serine protease Vpr